MYEKTIRHTDKVSHSCFLKFQFVYNDLKRAERKAADFCLTMPEFVASATIGEIAERAECSEATLVRLSKRLGYSGYPELRECILREDSEEIVHSFGISHTDDVQAVATAVFNASILSLSDSLASINFQCLQKTVDALHKARKILFAATGDAGIVAQSGMQKFNRIGLNASYNADFDTQLISISQMHKDDVLLCISHSGRTKNVCELAKVASGQKIFVISLTNFPQSPLVKISDTVLLTASFAHDMMGEILAKRLPALCLIDVIYVLMLLRLEDEPLDALDFGNKLLRINKL